MSQNAEGKDKRRWTKSFARGEIYFISLDPVFGSEIGGFKMRPVVVLSIRDLNNNNNVVTVIPGTDGERKDRRNFRESVRVEPDATNGLGKTTDFLCHQIRAVEKGRFTQWPRGVLSGVKLKEIAQAVRFTLGLNIE